MDEETKFYSTNKGTVALKGSAKNDIIKLLMEGDKTSSDIQDELGRAKSTISVHLSDLKKLGVIDERTHPEDSRKKIFSLKSTFVGSSDVPSKEQYNIILENLGDARGDRYQFLKTMFHLIRYGLHSLGLDLDPALKEMGRDAGLSLAEYFSSNDLEELIREIGEFWESNGLGKVSVPDRETILVHDCFDCGGMPEVDHELCSLDEGLLEGIIEGRLGLRVEIQERECSGTGADHCRFQIRGV
ncbi:MAG: V4R domain-containing protein [Thermoplasmata archaeon]